MTDCFIHNILDLCNCHCMIFSLKRVNFTVQGQDSHLIDAVSVLLRICLSESNQLIINKDRHLQAGSKLPSELSVRGKQTVKRFSLLFQYDKKFSGILLHSLIKTRNRLLVHLSGFLNNQRTSVQLGKDI